jgi:membrane-bound lytic murein transglycosylase B
VKAELAIKPRTRVRGFIFAALLMLCSPALADNSEPFDTWLDEFKADAKSQGISQPTIDEALTDIEPLPRVIELDQTQPETTLTLDEYLTRVVSDSRIKHGQEGYRDNKTLLRKIGKKYGVQPRFIVALWGVETRYGKQTGGFSIVESLATLAYDGRRSDFFRGELINALKIIDAGDISAADMKGSWAGAMGQCQFMPSSFLKFAVDYDHDGKRDIWDDKADIFASIANYLHESGWNADEGWGRPVTLPDDFDKSLADIKETKTLREWQELGVRDIKGKKLPAKKIDASLIMVGEGDAAVPYLIYNNYKVLLKWNRSRYFATSVGTLADRIGK